MVKIVIYKPYQEIWFKNPVRRVLRKQTIPSKYEPFFDYLARTHGRLFVSTRLKFRPGWIGRLDRLRDTIRILAWMLIHRIDPRRVGIVLTRKQFEQMDAVLFMYYGNFTHEQLPIATDGKELAEFFSASQVLKIVHMTHFAYLPSIGAENLRLLKPDLFVAENNLIRNSMFFRHYFSDISAQFQCLPYVAGHRFQKRKELSQRIHKLGVTGSITYKMHDPEFLEFFRQNELQPMRRRIYEERDRLEGLIDCLIYDLDESRQMEIKTLANSPKNARKTREEAMARQKSYYSVDIVEFFNRYTMFAVPEEICDLPGIGFIEGMACGSAYFGLDDPMYRDLGMVPGVHYVAYDGTVEGLVEKVAYYQTRRDELEVIAEQGYRFATEQMSADAVYSRFLDQLGQMRVVS
ncbi:MAG: glycosyltransferase [Betaproteobacteria bacterium]|nr:glycosyltransferase [Betaproteobacteria bacterium]